MILGAGAQLIHPSNQRESAQNPGTPAPVGSFNITELGDKADKIGEDDNFRGMTIFNNVFYYTKGSGDNAVYFLDTMGKACRPEQAGGDHRPAERHLPRRGRGLPDGPGGGVRRGAARRLVHPG